METPDMAVVVSQGQNEIAALDKLGPRHPPPPGVMHRPLGAWPAVVLQSKMMADACSFTLPDGDGPPSRQRPGSTVLRDPDARRALLPGLQIGENALCRVPSARVRLQPSKAVHSRMRFRAHGAVKAFDNAYGGLPSHARDALLHARLRFNLPPLQLTFFVQYRGRKRPQNCLVFRLDIRVGATSQGINDFGS